jgi:hypothetical protein
MFCPFHLHHVGRGTGAARAAAGTIMPEGGDIITDSETEIAGGETVAGKAKAA